jgi:potassium/hydrogen antiporter
MVISFDNILFIGSFLVLASVFAGKTSFRFGVPTLLLFLAIGIIAGSEGPGGIYFDSPHVAKFIGIVSLNFILFSGGLDTSWQSIKPIIWQGVSLSTVGVLLTALSVGIFVWAVTDFSIYEGLLLGAIVSSTDAAAVFSILRAKSMALKGRLRSILELESGSNDPMAYVLTIAFLSLVQSPEAGLASIVPFFIKQMFWGAAIGFAMGYFSRQIINHIKLDFEGLYPVLVISLIFLTYSLVDLVGGNGFLSVYLCGVFLGNSELIHKKTIIKVFDGMAWMMQISLFLILGMLVYPSQVLLYAGTGLLVSLFLIFVARPLGVFASLLPFQMKMRRRYYISWVGLRGAVPIVFATFPLIAGIEKAPAIFNIVFFVSVSSVILQGMTLNKMAHWMRVALPQRIKAKNPIDVFLSDKEKSAMATITIPESGFAEGKKVVDLKFPPSALIAVIERNGKYFSPNGSSVLEAADKLVVLADTSSAMESVLRCLQIGQPDDDCD